MRRNERRQRMKFQKTLPHCTPRIGCNPLKRPALTWLALLLILLSSKTIRAAAAVKEPGGGVDPVLLTHPETAFVANFVAISVDQQPLANDAPEVLFQKSGPDADFIAEVWKDAQGHVVHQREVLFVKHDYGVVVDYLYGWKGSHKVSCTITMPAGGVNAERGLSRFNFGNGKEFRVQHLGQAGPLADPVVVNSAGGKEVSEEYRLTLPAPFASIFYGTRFGEAKIEYVQPSNPMVVKCKVTRPNGVIDEVGIAWEYRDQLHLGGNVLKGWAAVARKGPGVMTNIEIEPPRPVTPTASREAVSSGTEGSFLNISPKPR